MDRPDSVRAYYAAIDDHAYDALHDLLDAEFTHYRPDRTIEGRTAFVRFMREERPRTDTTHELAAVYRTAEDPTDTGTEDPAAAEEVAVRGRLCGADGGVLFSFVDVHGVVDDRIVSLRTFTDR